MVELNRLIRKMQFAHDILANPSPGKIKVSHHGFYSTMICEEDDYIIQVCPKTWKAGYVVSSGRPAFIITSTKRKYLRTPNNIYLWKGYTEAEVSLFLLAAQEVDSIYHHWNGVGCSSISIEWDFLPNTYFLKENCLIDLPEAYHKI